MLVQVKLLSYIDLKHRDQSKFTDRATPFDTHVLDRQLITIPQLVFI